MQCCICTCCHWQNLFASDAICVSVPGTADVTGADRAEWVFTADRAVNDRWAEHSDQWILGLQSLWHDRQPPRQRPVSFYHSEILCYLHYCIIIIIIIHEFHRDTSLEQNFRAAVCHVLHYSCNVNAVADSLRCRMICGTVPSSVHAWMPP